MQNLKNSVRWLLAMSVVCALACAGALAQTIVADLGLTLDLGNGVTMKLASIPAGKFLKGSPLNENGHANDESDRNITRQAQQDVTISKPYFLGTTEVTQAQYEQIMGKNPSHFKGAQNPVDNVSWIDALEFCKKLSEKTGQAVRLPTEAEWEYACRAGSTSRYYYGDDQDYAQLGEYVWYAANSEQKTHAVGQKKPNAWGLYDMGGNVWEWCSDVHGGPYDLKPETDPTGPKTGTIHIMRGGCWDTGPLSARSANRGGMKEERKNSRFGFRVVVVGK